MLNTEERSTVLYELARDAVPDTVDVWPALDRRLSSRRRAQATRRWLAIAATAAGVVGIATLASVPLWSAPEAVNAQTILDRAETVSDSGATTAVSTYHLLMTRTAKGAAITSEVWFSGVDLQRTVQQVTGSNGAVISRQNVVFNGPEAWIEDTENGVTRVIHTTGTTWTRPADSPSAKGNLSELIQSLGDKSCMAVSLLQNGATIAGQDTYVIRATPTRVGCGRSRSGAALESSPAAAEPSPVAADQRGLHVNGQPAGSRIEEQPAQLTIWVDKRSFLTLKTEVRDPHDVVTDRSEVSRVEYNISTPQATFAYTPPPGIAVATFSGGDGADVKRMLASTQSERSEPVKSH
jgi:hypothetical protein